MNMSTRAIVGYKRTDGTIIAWCWNDRYNIKNDLKPASGILYIQKETRVS